MVFCMLRVLIVGGAVLSLLIIGGLTPTLAAYDYASAIHAVRHDTNRVRHDKRWLYRLYARLALENHEHDRRGI